MHWHGPMHHRKRGPTNPVDFEGRDPVHQPKTHLRNAPMDLVVKGVVELSFQGLLDAFAGVQRHGTSLHVVEGTNVIHAGHVVLVFVGVHHRIKALHPCPEHLLTKIRTGIHHDVGV